MLTNNHLTTNFVFDNVPASIPTLKYFIGPFMKKYQYVPFPISRSQFSKYKFELHRQNHLKSSLTSVGNHVGKGGGCWTLCLF